MGIKRKDKRKTQLDGKIVGLDQRAACRRAVIVLRWGSNMDILAGIQAAKTGLDLIKLTREMLKRENVDHHEVSNRLMEIHERLVESREALGDAAEEIRELKGRIAARDRESELDKEFVYEGFCILESQGRDA